MTPEPGGARVGLYGGTFNPIHLGHLRAAQEVLEALDLERVVFIPSARPPHKEDGKGEVIAPAGHRLAWLEGAIANHPRFETDRIEIDRSGPSYLVDTLRSLAPAMAPEKPIFIVGRDAFQEMGSWREPRALFTLAHLAVTHRPPQSGILRDWVPECVRDDLEIAPDGRSGRHRSAGTWLRQLDITALDISASEIRTRIRKGRSIRYLVPESVRESIETADCYRRSG